MIALDVGNSRVKFGRFRDDQLVLPTLPVCEEVFAVSLDSAEMPWDQLGDFFQRDITAGIHHQSFVASVNPDGLSWVLAEWPEQRWVKPRLIQSNADLPIVNLTRYPEKVGTDRLLKALAANLLRRPDEPIIVVDSGTATTVDWITPQGEFAGGAILPGLELSSKALHTHTAQLPLIEMQELDQPATAIGRETTAALQSGLYWGHVGAVKEVISQMILEQRHAVAPSQILVTGGGGELLARSLDHAIYRPTLTLEGLAIASHHLL